MEPLRSLKPLLKDTLCGLKVKIESLTDIEKEEKDRKKLISNIVDLVYENVVLTAEKTLEKTYAHEVAFNVYRFCIKNMNDILRELKLCFPDSKIEFIESTVETVEILQCLGGNRRIKWYPLFIVIDWSE
jgi:hypothetical protein